MLLWIDGLCLCMYVCNSLPTTANNTRDFWCNVLRPDWHAVHDRELIEQRNHCFARDFTALFRLGETIECNLVTIRKSAQAILTEDL